MGCSGVGAGGRGRRGLCQRRAHTSHACTPSKEICEAHDIFMCPRGDHSRKYHRLSDTCTFAKVCHLGPGSPCRRGLACPPREGEAEVGSLQSWAHPSPRRGDDGSGEAAPRPHMCLSPQLTHLFDNDGTVLFAIFMAVWGKSPQGSWPELQGHSCPQAPGPPPPHPSQGHPVMPLCAPGCSHGVPGDLEAAARPCGPALGPVWVGRGPGESGQVSRALWPQSWVCRGGECAHVRGVCICV